MIVHKHKATAIGNPFSYFQLELGALGSLTHRSNNSSLRITKEVVTMASFHKDVDTDSSPIILDVSANTSEENAVNWYKLHLVMDDSSYSRLVSIKGALQAASFQEVIRRALQAYAIYEPDDLCSTTAGSKPVAATSSAATSRHVYIKVPLWVKDVLETEKREHKRSYGETVRQSLRVLFQLLRNRDALIEQKGNKDGKNLNDQANLLALL